MAADIIEIEKTYQPHLSKQGIRFALDLRFDPRTEGNSFLVDSLKQFLKGQLLEATSDWNFSFLGPLVHGKNLSVLQFISAHEFEVRLGISETWKPQEEFPMPFTEVLLASSPVLVERFLQTPKLDFGWDFSLGGYKKIHPKDSHLPGRFLFNEGCFNPPAGAYEIAFCSSPDWDAIQFFSLDETKLTALKTQLGL